MFKSNNHHLPFIIIFSLLLTSCGNGEPTNEDIYQVTKITHNVSGHQVTIIYYGARYSDFNTSPLTLPNDSTLIETGEIIKFGGIESGVSTDLPISSSLDSVHIIFDDERMTSHCPKYSLACRDPDRNIILNFFNISLSPAYTQLDTAEYTYYYEITEADYEAAEPL